MNDTILMAANTIAGICIGIGGWIFRMIFSQLKEYGDKHDEQEKALQSFKLDVSEKHALKSDVDKKFDKIVDKLDLIFEKLDKKADK